MDRPLVLVIDDEPAIRLLCRVNLEAEGMRVCEAADGASGIERARDEPPDAILLDVMLPGEDGLAVAERMRGVDVLRDVPILFLTARADLGDGERIRQAGGSGCLTKPFNPLVLAETVRGLLAAR
jgi:CheY-like chemotaxis protein